MLLVSINLFCLFRGWGGTETRALPQRIRPSEKLSFALVPRSNVLRMTVRLAHFPMKGLTLKQSSEIAYNCATREDEVRYGYCKKHLNFRGFIFFAYPNTTPNEGNVLHYSQKQTNQKTKMAGKALAKRTCKSMQALDLRSTGVSFGHPLTSTCIDLHGFALTLVELKFGRK